MKIVLLDKRKGYPKSPGFSYEILRWDSEIVLISYRRELAGFILAYVFYRQLIEAHLKIN